MASNLFPCFDHATLVALIERAHLNWRYYGASPEAIWIAPNSIKALCNAQKVKGKVSCTGKEWANVVLNPATVLSDISTCNLANVTWVTPTGQNSDHPSINTGGGPSWAASIVNEIGNSKCGYWQNTALLLTWMIGEVGTITCRLRGLGRKTGVRSEEHTSELQSLRHLVC